MTYLQIQTEVMDRLNLTSTEARTRIKAFINARYRKLATSCSLGRVRFGTVSFATVAGTFTYSPATLAKPLTISYAGGNRILEQRTMDEIRLNDPDSSTTGAPQTFCLQKFGATTCTLYIWPKPDAIYTLSADGILVGTELAADGDIPVFPEDFHDILVFGGCADELMKMEKPSLSEKMELQTAARSRDLRYYMAKTTYLNLQQGEQGFWWYGPWFGSYRGFY